MEQYFRRLADIAVDKSYPSRIRFMLNDLIDMRKNGYGFIYWFWPSLLCDLAFSIYNRRSWVGLGTDDTPKTIEEVHKSLAKEVCVQSCYFIRHALQSYDLSYKLSFRGILGGSEGGQRCRHSTSISELRPSGISTSFGRSRSLISIWKFDWSC